MLAMVVNDNTLNQMPRGALWFFANMLAPTGRQSRLFQRLFNAASAAAISAWRLRITSPTGGPWKRRASKPNQTMAVNTPSRATMAS